MQKNPEHMKRTDDRYIKVPTWVAAILVGVAITFSGVVFKSFAADEAKKLDKEHIDLAIKRFDKDEDKISDTSIRVTILETDMVHIKDSMGAINIVVNQNHNLIIKIASKLQIPTE